MNSAGRLRVLALAGISLALAGCFGSSKPNASPSTTLASPTPTTAGFDVVAENAKPGLRKWLLPAGLAGSTLEGYADRTSVIAGEQFGIYVSSSSASVRVLAVRIGWYGGTRGRLIWHSPSYPTRLQTAKVVDTSTKSYRAPWTRTCSISTTGWPEGDYLLRLDGADGNHSYIPLTVRSATTAGRVVFMNSVLTWEAYNTWGGRSLYDGESGGFSSRSYAVSFDRPYQNGGLGLFASFELQPVATAERYGVTLAYETDVDVATRPGLLARAVGIISPGHDEYWTVAERIAVEAARDHGTNLAFLGANVSYWRVRLASSALGPNRLELGYKESGTDPVTGATATSRFRDPPDPRPEQLMTGQRYECYPVSGPMVVRDPGFFLFAGTGARAGSSYPGLIGVEIDRPYPIATTPRPLQVAALSPVTCHGVNTVSGFTYYTTRSGAGVVAVGTMNWTRALAGAFPAHGITDAAYRFALQVTENIYRAVGTPGLGRIHPAHDELYSAGLSSVNSTGVG